MKLKKWLSRALVLAMVVALMIPVPVAAKSSGGGKLVKSVTYYYQDSQTGRWQAGDKTSFTYNKKNYPATERVDDYGSYFLGIPMSSEVTLYDYAYKFKGGSPKSLKVKNSVGTVIASQTYKKGNVVRENSTWNWSEIIDGVEKVGCSTSDTYLTYGKSGLVSEVAGGGLTVRPDGTSENTTGARTSYAWTAKKGVPSFMLRQVTFQDGSFYKEYNTYNKKGLLVESGDIDNTTGAPTASFVYQYTMKKGLVKEVIVYYIDPETKASRAVGMYKFNYTKTKISKARYSKMINSFVSYFNAPGAYNWY